MSTPKATIAAARSDAICTDWLPACPACGDLNAKGATTCECGARLTLTDLNAATVARIGKQCRRRRNVRAGQVNSKASGELNAGGSTSAKSPARGSRGR